MINLKVYDDGTAVARIVRKNNATSIGARTCLYEMLFFRIIHPNGTVDEKDIDNERLGISSINYCFFTINARPIKFLDYFLIRKNHILITYVETTNPDDPSTYEDWGMIIDFDGKIYDSKFFGPRYIDINTNEFVPETDPTILLNVNREKGFLRLYSLRGKISRQEWQQYVIEPDGKFTELTSGIVPIYSDALVGQLKSLRDSSISTVDEGYAIVFGITVNNLTSTAENPLLQQGQLLVLPIGYNQTATSPLLLYQTSLPNLNFTGLDCSISFTAEVGQTCVLAITQRS
jgi:hypothetical protein